MRHRHITVTGLLALLCVAVSSVSYSDILKLTDGRILNGKIIQQSNRELTFASSRNTVIIRREMIAEAYKTASPEEDRSILLKMGVNLRDLGIDIETNYSAGELKLEEYLNTGSIQASPDEADLKTNLLSISAGFGRNYSSLSEAIPYGFYAGLSYAKFSQSASGLVHLSFRSEAGLCRFAERGKSLTGFTLLAGSMWSFGSNHVVPYLSCMAGPSYFLVNDSENEIGALTVSVVGDVGVGFNFDSVCISPFLRIFYAHDTENPLVGASFQLSCGIRW